MSEAVRAALSTIVEGGSLSMDEARAAMGSVMDGEATAAQLAALLMGLRMRGETVEDDLKAEPGTSGSPRRCRLMASPRWAGRMPG